MNRRSFLLASLATLSGASAAGGLAYTRLFSDSDRPRGRFGDTELRRRPPAPDAPNVLFISIDDLNDWLGFLNDHPGTRTPNLDALAATSLVFTHAYCPAPLCLPARTAVLFGKQPYTSGIYDHEAESRARYEEMKRITPSLIDDVWAAGYDTFGAGKVFHGGEESRWTEYRRTVPYVEVFDRDDRGVRPEQFDPDWRSPYDGRPIGRGERALDGAIDFGPSGVAAEDEPDGQATEWVRSRLRERHDRPFLVGLGLILPHLPWRLPQRYFALHPLDDVVVPEIRPDDLDDLSGYARDNFVDPFDTFEVLRESGLWEEAVQAYQAAITFVDDRVGLLLDELASSPNADDTLIVVWSDHGFHLAEKLHLGKMTLWERATHVPLLIHAPGRFDSHQAFDPPVSTIDLGPTVAELCRAEVHAPHDGRSLLPLVAAPDRADERPPLTTWLPGNHSVRRGPWRYIRYATGDRELYDHDSDPDEFVNLAGRASHSAVEAELDAFLPDPMSD